DPVIIDQAREHERKKADGDPVGLLPPKIRRDRVFAHVGSAVDGDDAEDGQRQHENKKQPVEPEQFSKKRGHVDLIQRELRLFRVYAGPEIRNRLSGIWRPNGAILPVNSWPRLNASPENGVIVKSSISKACLENAK